MSEELQTDWLIDNRPADGARSSEGWDPYEVWRTRVLQPSLEAAPARAPSMPEMPKRHKRLSLFRNLWRSG